MQCIVKKTYKTNQDSNKNYSSDGRDYSNAADPPMSVQMEEPGPQSTAAVTGYQYQGHLKKIQKVGKQSYVSTKDLESQPNASDGLHKASAHPERHRRKAANRTIPQLQDLQIRDSERFTLITAP